MGECPLCPPATYAPAKLIAFAMPVGYSEVALRCLNLQSCLEVAPSVAKTCTKVAPTLFKDDPIGYSKISTFYAWVAATLNICNVGPQMGCPEKDYLDLNYI